MKLSFFHYLALLSCLIALLCIQVDAQQSTDLLAAESDQPLEFTAEALAQLEQIIEDVMNERPQGGLGTTAERRRRDQELTKRGVFTDVLNFFKDYWGAFSMITHGQFGEQLFEQLKRSGSWCESTKFTVTVAKHAVDSVLGGVIGDVCNCVYPMIKGYPSFMGLIADIGSKGLHHTLSSCPAGLQSKLLKGLRASNN
ncbi:hypothetical protein BGZ68_003547 [Mortierella alpina]|nr:hypothetical protein BGZ68_003547 [Mortierella alpina]